MMGVQNIDIKMSFVTWQHTPNIFTNTTVIFFYNHDCGICSY